MRRTPHYQPYLVTLLTILLSACVASRPNAGDERDIRTLDASPYICPEGVSAALFIHIFRIEYSVTSRSLTKAWYEETIDREGFGGPHLKTRLVRIFGAAVAGGSAASLLFGSPYANALLTDAGGGVAFYAVPESTQVRLRVCSVRDSTVATSIGQWTLKSNQSVLCPIVINNMNHIVALRAVVMDRDTLLVEQRHFRKGVSEVYEAGQLALTPRSVMESVQRCLEIPTQSSGRR